MDAPPPYPGSAAPRETPTVLGLALPPWVGHMDAQSAVMRAFLSGIDDAHAMSYGQHKPELGGAAIEIQYLRGFAFGSENAGHSLAATRSLDVSQHARDDLIGDLFPNPWRPPAILPFPIQRHNRPPRHSVPDLGPFSVLAMPQIPLPDVIDRTYLTATWDPDHVQRLFNFPGYGCWVALESPLLGLASTAAIKRALASISAKIFAGQIAPTAHHPTTMLGRMMGAVFVEGTKHQVVTLVRARVLVSTMMNLFVFPNCPRRSSFVCTFKGGQRPLDDDENVMWDVRHAIENCQRAKDFCESNNKNIEEVTSSITLEFVDVHGEYMWNVSMDFPGPEQWQANRWRWIVSQLSPEDGAGGTMSSVRLRCKVCQCCHHVASLCPTRAYEEWTGAISDDDSPDV